MRIWRAATVEKKPGRIARSCLPMEAPGILHILKPRRWSGVVKYCASTGVANLARSSATPIFAVIIGGKVRMKVKATRSRKNHVMNAQMGVFEPPSFEPFVPNIFALRSADAQPVRCFGCGLLR